MVDYVKGKIVHKSPTSVIIEIGGFGMKINIPISTSESIGNEGDEVKLLTFVSIKNEELNLYGFATLDEKELFRKLVSIQGIGTKTALGILSEIKVDDFERAVVEEDIFTLTSIHGIGPKTAEKLVRQLNDPAILRIIERLKESGLNFSIETEQEREELPQLFAGEEWCVTGSFVYFKPRDAAMEEVKKRGGKVTTAVTGKTTHLLAGANPGSKLDKAKKFGTTIVNEEEFMKRIGILYLNSDFLAQ